MIAKYKFMKVISNEYSVSQESIMSRDRTKKLTEIRLVLWWALREAGYSYPAIGQYTRRDHSTVLKLLQRYEAGFREKGRKIYETLLKDDEWEGKFEVETVKIPDYKQNKIVEIQRIIKKL